MSQQVKVSTLVRAPKESVWDYFTTPVHITRWNFAISEWHCPKAENDLRSNGRFSYRMEAKDGSVGFDFSGTYTEVVAGKALRYTLDDGRKVNVTFDENAAGTRVTEIFEAEAQNPVEMQQHGWQSILDNFRNYTENRL